MSTASATAGENRDSGQDRHPMDLASKNTLKPGESVKTVVNTQQHGNHGRGLTGTVGHVQSRILSSGISSVGSVPVCVTTTNSQAPVKQGVTGIGDQGGGLASVVLMSVSRSGLPSNASASSAVASLGQSASAACRPSSTPTVAATTTYHVPRGAAAVANIAAPRPGTAALGRTTSGTTAITHASNLVTGLRGLVPRAPSPASTWLGAVSQSPATSGTRARAPTVTSMNSYAQPRTPTLAVTARPTTPQGTRVQAEPLRSQALHSGVQKLPTAQNASTVSAAPQVLVTQSRSQPSSASTPVSVSSSTAAPRVLSGTTTVTSVPSVATIATAASPAPSVVSQRPIQTALLTTAPRSAPVTSNVRPVNSVNVSSNRSSAASAAVTGATATLALAVGTQVRPRLTTAGASRLTATVPAPRLLTTPARPPTASTTTVLPSQARLGVQGQASVVSLHPVVVSTGGGLPLKSATVRPSLGPKVISQPLHAPASIQITQMPVTAVQAAAKLPASVSPALPQSPATRTVSYSANAAVVTGSGGSVRPMSVTTSTLASPVTKVTLHATASQPSVAQQVAQQPQSQQSSQSQGQQASVCIQHRASPAPSAPATPLTVEHAGASVLSTYNIPAYLYEPSAGGGGSTYQVTGVVARPYTASGGASGATAAGATYTVQTSAAAVLRPSGVVATSAPLKFNPVVVVDPSRSSLPVHSSYLQEGGLTATSETAPPPPPPPTVTKPSASPRPSILRKRDNEGSPMKAQKNLTPILSSLGATPASAPAVTTTASNAATAAAGAGAATPSATIATAITTATAGSSLTAASPVSPPSPRRPDSRGGGGGNSSGGSTTISATSSPGLGEASEDTTPIVVKQEVGEEPIERPPPEMSPRKKPRKQQLTGNELHEPKFSEDEMEFISEERIKKEVKEGRLRGTEETFLHIPIPPPEEPIEKPAALPPARRRGLSLLAGYRHNWKSRHNHYARYSDVRPKDERRPTVSELAAQKQVLQKLDGWKVHHLSTQMEELSELEQQVSERLSGILKHMEKRMGKELEKDINRINELIKGNMQRSKVTSDQMQEAKIQVMKIFEHKNHVADIINRSGNKRSLKKREKS